MKWRSEPLGQACPIVARKVEEFAGERRYFPTGTVNESGGLSQPDLVAYSTRPSRAGCMPRAGDIGFARMKGTKKSLLVDEALEGSLFSTGFCFVAPEPHIAPRYAFYFTMSGYFQDTKDELAGDGIMGGIKNADVANIRIPVPPLTEQRRIVTILDEAFASIVAAKGTADKNVQTVRALAGVGYQAIIEKFDRSRWPIVPVAAIASARKGSMRTGPFGSQLLHSEFVAQGVAVLGIDNAVANEFRWDRRRFISEDKYRQLARYRVLPGDVLITIMGTCGRCAVVPKDIPLAINTKHLCCITLDREKCLPEYLHVYFLHDALAREFLGSQVKGSIMEGLNMGIVAELPVRLPPIEQQVEIVDRFQRLRAEIQRLEGIYQRKLSALDELKHSLLHQAFSGQL